MFNVIMNPTTSQYINFSNALQISKNTNKKGCYVSYFSPAQLDALKCKLFILPTEMAGFAITGDNELIALFKNLDCPVTNVLAKALPIAKAYGARRLECFEPLVKMYESHGFHVVTETSWNDDYMPKDWNVSERPSYYTMKV